MEKSPNCSSISLAVSRAKKRFFFAVRETKAEELLMVENRKGENFVVGGGRRSGVSELGEEACGKRRRRSGGGGEMAPWGEKRKVGKRPRGAASSFFAVLV